MIITPYLKIMVWTKDYGGPDIYDKVLSFDLGKKGYEIRFLFKLEGRKEIIILEKDNVKNFTISGSVNVSQ